MPGGSKALQSLNQPWWVGFHADTVARVLTSDYLPLLDWLNQQSSDRGLCTGRGLPLQFGPQAILPEGHAYEHWIAQTGIVPTRDNYHDRLNALVWLTYPLTKAALNREQAEAIETQTEPSRRGPVRDAATLWDENLALIVERTPDQQLKSLLEQANWHELFVAQRSRWGSQWQVYCFGHALLEKLMSPYKAITAHTIVLTGQEHRDDGDIDNGIDNGGRGSIHDQRTAMESLDDQLSQRVSAAMSPAVFRPLPVMGIPGWDPAQDQDDFYQDTAVFRRPRQQ